LAGSHSKLALVMPGFYLGYGHFAIYKYGKPAHRSTKSR
jgi:hypothetical protein